MYNPNETDSTKWRYKRRHGVLGFWRQVKLMEWEYHIAECEKRENIEIEEGDFEEY
jgi:hypothetical protein